MNLRISILSERIQTKRKYILYDSVFIKSRICNYSSDEKESKSMVIWELGAYVGHVRIGKGRKERLQGYEKFGGVMNMSIILIVVMVSLMCTYAKTHQIAQFKHV